MLIFVFLLSLFALKINPKPGQVVAVAYDDDAPDGDAGGTSTRSCSSCFATNYELLALFSIKKNEFSFKQSQPCMRPLTVF